MTFEAPSRTELPSQVSAAILHAVYLALRAQGFGDELEARLPQAASQRVDWDECMRRLRVVLSLTRDPALGLVAGERATIAALHTVGHLLISCSTLREAVQLFLRFAPLVFSGARFALREAGDVAHFVFEPPACDEEAGRFCAELALTLAKGVGDQFPCVDNTTMICVRFRHGAPSYAERYAAVFGCPIEFNAPNNEILMPRARLDARHGFADERLKQMLSARAEHLLEEQLAERSIAHRVRAALRSADLDCVDLDRMARSLGMPTHGLQRKLREQGVTFSALLDEVRRELACAALEERSVCIKALSERLGFSEPCAFHRAFRRWTGTTPARYRERALSGAQATA